jgi:hypothetical protein
MPGPQAKRAKGIHYDAYRGNPPKKETKHIKRVKRMQAQREMGYSEVSSNVRSGFTKPGSQSLR